MSALVLRWRVPEPLIGPRWRGSEGGLYAVSRKSAKPLAAFLVPAATYTAEGPGLTLAGGAFSLDFSAIGDQLGLPELAAALDAIPEYTASGDGLKLALGQFSLDYAEIGQGLGLPAFAAAIDAAFAAIPEYTASGNGIELTGAQFSLNYGEIDTGLGLTANFAPKASPVFTGIVTAPQIVAPTLTLGDAGVANRIYLDGTKTSIVGDVIASGQLTVGSGTGGRVNFPTNGQPIHVGTGANQLFINAGSYNLSLGNFNNSSAMVLTSTGNVGIRTSAPQNAFDIFTVAGGASHAMINAGNSNTVPWLAVGSGGVGDWAGSTFGFGWLYRNDTGDLELQRKNNSTTANHFLTLQRSTGNLGLGTNAPAGRLHVKQADQTAGLVLEDSASTRLIRLFQSGGGFQNLYFGDTFRVGAEAAIAEDGFVQSGRSLTFRTFDFASAGAFVFEVNGTNVANLSRTGSFTVSGNLTARPPAAAAALTVNGEMTFEFTTNTTLKIKARGTDGVVREASLALA